MAIFLRVAYTVPVATKCPIDDPTPCRCEMVNDTHDQSTYHVNCSGEGLTAIPTLPEDFTSLDFSYNHLRPDRLHTLCKYTRVEHVSLSYNNLNELPVGELRDCHITGSIDFEGNVFNTINARSLIGLEEVLTISGLEAQSFDEDAFLGLGNIEKLSLKTYQTEVPENLFASLELKSLSLFLSGAFQIPDNLFNFGSTSLTELHIESPSLQNLPYNLLQTLTKLETVSLKMEHMQGLPVYLFKSTARTWKNIHISGVHTLPRRMFYGLTSLTKLELNQIISVHRYLLRGRVLEYLDVTGSNIEQGRILFYFLYDQTALKILNISKCGISSLDATMFLTLKSLENLNVAFNEIKFLTFQPFKHIQSTVKEIILKGNGIQGIGSEVFRNLTKLETLDLSENNIHTLNERSFEDLMSLKSLLLQRNKIASVPSGLFRTLTNLNMLNLAFNVFGEDPGGALENAIHLEVLDLSNNHVRTFSEALVDNLVDLRVLNLEYNPLHCDCYLLRRTERLLSRGVRMNAWCFTPVHQRINDAEPEKCTDDISTEVVTSTSASTVESAKTSSFTSQTSEDATIVSLVTHDVLNNSSHDLTHLSIKPTQEEYVIKNTHFTVQEKYYMAVAFMCSVSLFCVVTLVCLACKNRKARLYEISRMLPSRNIDIDRLGDPQSATRTDVSASSSMNSPRVSTDAPSVLEVVREVPSVQIEVVDDQGRVRSEMYDASEVPIMDN